MSRAYIFSDEAGCLTFKKDNNVSRYFIVCTIMLPDCAIGDRLLSLRRDMVWRELPVEEEFHATEDRQIIRDEVFDYISTQDFRIDATLLDKPKAQPHIAKDKHTFYKYAWYYHLKKVGLDLLKDHTEALFTTASIATKKGQAVFSTAANEVLQQVVPHKQWRAFFPRTVSDPCLQLADYCAWAIQKKWERKDERSYEIIKDKIVTEYDLWKWGSNTYY